MTPILMTGVLSLGAQENKQRPTTTMPYKNKEIFFMAFVY
jgi:hypothetical protein